MNVKQAYNIDLLTWGPVFFALSWAAEEGEWEDESEYHLRMLGS